jgi:hypothetical protein
MGSETVNDRGLTVAFGPIAPGWGSWDWVGSDLVTALAGDFRTRSFPAWEVPRCDALVVVKHPPPPGWLDRLDRHTAVVYCPVDAFGQAAEIDAAAPWLRRCDRVLVHCERLRRYFEPYTRVDYLDHHVKFAAAVRDEFRTEGDILWVGVRSNLPPLVGWVNAHPLPAPLDVLTNFEDPGRPPSPSELGFRGGVAVRVHDWSPRLHTEMTAAARAAIDIKGADFRSWHKPPAKGIDFIASGVPLAMNPDSSTAEHLGRMGFEVADPLDTGRWLSRDYWAETRRFGMALRELLSLERVARRIKRVIDDAVAERRGRVPDDPLSRRWNA